MFFLLFYCKSNKIYWPKKFLGCSIEEKKHKWVFADNATNIWVSISLTHFFNCENISFPNIEKWKVFLCVSFQLMTLDFHDTIQILSKVLIPWRFSYFQVVWETDLQKLYCVYCTLLCHSFSHCFLIICEINRTKVKREQHSAAQRRNTKWKNTPLWAHKYPNTRSTLDVMSNIYGIISNIIKISWGFWETINVKKNVSNNHKR